MSLPVFPRSCATALLVSLTAGLLLADSPLKTAKDATTKADVAANPDAIAIDQKVIEEVKAHAEVMKNLQYLCDVIGPRMTGSAKLEKANNWTAKKMTEYGLTDVHLEAYEIPVGWERGTASLTFVEPNPGKTLTVAAAAWTPGTKGKITGEVVFLDAKTKEDLAKYKGKLKDAIILRSPPADVKPVSDLSYLNSAPRPAAAPGPMNPMGAEPKKEEPKKEEAKKDDQPAARPMGGAGGAGGGRGAGFGEVMAFQRALAEFVREEGAAVLLRDSAKPHGLLTMTGSWPNAGGNRGGAADGAAGAAPAGDRAAPPEPMPSLFITHEHYTMLYRMATSKDSPKPKMELEITNKFVPGPIPVYNTVGEIKGSEKPDEFVVVGAHLDSWDLGSGATDNGTGSCTVLEVARTLSALAKAGFKPKRTIRFVLFSGEEQGLYGSKAYVKKHKDEMPKTSVALVHDTGTGKVYGFGLQGREAVKKVLDPEVESLKSLESWKGLTLKSLNGTDHQSFEAVGVPGFACDQDMDEYRLTHHTQTDTFDHVKEPNLIQGAQVMAVMALRIANLPDLLPRDKTRPMRPNPMDEKKPEEKKP